MTNGVSFSVESGEVVGLLLIGSLYLEANVPGGLIGLWVVCLLLTLIGYRWAESRFQRIEAPMGPLCGGGGEAL